LLPAKVGDRGRKTVLEKLDNNEAVLLMYLAGELPAVDRAEIERMLAGDLSLRKQLAGMRLAYETTENALHAVDSLPPRGGRAGLEPGSTAEAAAMRRIGRTMRSHLARQIAERPAPAAKRGLRYPWWAYPTSAIAASVLAFLVWWANSTGNGQLYIRGEHTLQQPYPVATVEDPQVKTVTRFWQQSEDAKQDQIDANERAQAQELAAITNDGDDEGAVWKIGSSDAHE
jgi:anti-sigma factor RsiW